MTKSLAFLLEVKSLSMALQDQVIGLRGSFGLCLKPGCRDDSILIDFCHNQHSWCFIVGKLRLCSSIVLFVCLSGLDLHVTFQ